MLVRSERKALAGATGPFDREAPSELLQVFQVPVFRHGDIVSIWYGALREWQGPWL